MNMANPQAGLETEIFDSTIRSPASRENYTSEFQADFMDGTTNIDMGFPMGNLGGFPRKMI